MKKMKLLFACCFFFASLTVFSQKEDTVFVNKLLLESKSLFGSDPQKAIKVAEQARDVAHKINYPEGEATALKNIGIVYYMQQKYVETLDYWNQSLQIFEASKDDIGVANLLNNIAAVYKDRGDDDKGLEYALRSLTIAEKTGDILRIYSSLITIGSIYHNKKDAKALEYLLRARTLSNKDGLGVIDGNIGEVHFDLAEALEKDPAAAATMQKYYNDALKYYQQSIEADAQAVSTAYSYNGIGKVYYKLNKLDLSIQNHEQALALAQKLEDKWNIFKACQGIANANMKLGSNKSAIDNYNKALAFAEEVDNNDVADLYRDMSTAYAGISDFKNAFAYQTKFTEKQKQIYDIEQEKKLGRLQLNFDIYKKDQDLTTLEQQRKIEQQAKTGFAIGLGLILIIAAIIFRNYRVKARINKILDKQKAEIEGLLLNILPAEVAKELQSSGKATPKHYDNVSVLFTDFKGFTTIADKMTPSDLVSQLNDCFIAFDAIIEKYGLEKIKTIGDAYMCAGGIPTADPKHSYKIVKAAIEIQEWVKQNNDKRVANGLEPWDIRIGVHTGPLVAGVVGKKKYAYDIWGTTVNIASRMESNGEPGRVNISAAAYETVKEHFSCSYRGKIHAKNVGDIDMYFVDKEIIPYRIIGEEKTSLADVKLN